MRPFRRRGSYKGKEVHARVLARKIAGKSNRQIAREEGIDQHTIARILSQSGYDEICDQMKKESVELLPECVRVCRRELQRRGPERIRVALDFLHGHQILVNR
jgi:predicted transcriptional regulator